MTRVHTVRLLIQCMAGTVEFILIDLPCEDAVTTGSVAEERDYRGCAYEEIVDNSGKSEGQLCKARAMVPHRV